jgi:hypothetical protein
LWRISRPLCVEYGVKGKEGQGLAVIGLCGWLRRWLVGGLALTYLLFVVGVWLALCPLVIWFMGEILGDLLLKKLVFARIFSNVLRAC